MRVSEREGCEVFRIGSFHSGKGELQSRRGNEIRWPYDITDSERAVESILPSIARYLYVYVYYTCKRQPLKKCMYSACKNDQKVKTRNPSIEQRAV